MGTGKTVLGFNKRFNWISNGDMANGEPPHQSQFDPVNDPVTKAKWSVVELENPGATNYVLKTEATASVNTECQVHPRLGRRNDNFTGDANPENKTFGGTGLQGPVTYTLRCWVAWSANYNGDFRTLHSRWYNTDGTAQGTTGGTPGACSDAQYTTKATCEAASETWCDILETRTVGSLTWKHIEESFSASSYINGNFALYLGYPTDSTAGERYITGVEMVGSGAYHSGFSTNTKDGLQPEFTIYHQDAAKGSSHMTLNTPKVVALWEYNAVGDITNMAQLLPADTPIPDGKQWVGISQNNIYHCIRNYHPSVCTGEPGGPSTNQTDCEDANTNGGVGVWSAWNASYGDRRENDGGGGGNKFLPELSFQHGSSNHGPYTNVPGSPFPNDSAGVSSTMGMQLLAESHTFDEGDDSDFHTNASPEHGYYGTRGAYVGANLVHFVDSNGVVLDWPLTGTCTNVQYTTKATCEAASETWAHALSNGLHIKKDTGITRTIWENYQFPMYMMILEMNDPFIDDHRDTNIRAGTLSGKSSDTTGIEMYKGRRPGTYGTSWRWTGDGIFLNPLGEYGMRIQSGGRTVSRADTGAGWDARAYIGNGITGGCVLSFRCSSNMDQPVHHIMMGLTSSNQTTEYWGAFGSYDNIDYAWYMDHNDTGPPPIPGEADLRIYESGNHVAQFGHYDSTTLLQLVYDNDYVRYYKDGVMIREVNVDADIRFYAHGAFHGNSTDGGPRTVTDITWTPYKIFDFNLKLRVAFDGELVDTGEEGTNTFSVSPVADNVAPLYVEGKINQAWECAHNFYIGSNLISDTWENEWYVDDPMSSSLKSTLKSDDFYWSFWWYPVNQGEDAWGSDIMHFHMGEPADQGVGEAYPADAYNRLIFSNGRFNYPQHGGGGSTSSGCWWGGKTIESDDNASESVENQTPISNNEWHHVICVLERGTEVNDWQDGYLAIYLDGALIADGTRTVPVWDDATHLCGFKDAGSFGNDIAGDRMDDFRIYSGKLSDGPGLTPAQDRVDLLYNDPLKLYPEHPDSLNFPIRKSGFTVHTPSIISIGNYSPPNQPAPGFKSQGTVLSGAWEVPAGKKWILYSSPNSFSGRSNITNTGADNSQDSYSASNISLWEDNDGAASKAPGYYFNEPKFTLYRPRCHASNWNPNDDVEFLDIADDSDARNWFDPDGPLNLLDPFDWRLTYGRLWQLERHGSSIPPGLVSSVPVWPTSEHFQALRGHSAMSSSVSSDYFIAHNSTKMNKYLEYPGPAMRCLYEPFLDEYYCSWWNTDFANILVASGDSLIKGTLLSDNNDISSANFLNWNGMTASFTWGAACTGTGTPVYEVTSEGWYHVEVTHGAHYIGPYFTGSNYIPTKAGVDYYVEVTYSYENEAGSGASIQFYDGNDTWDPTEGDVVGLGDASGYTNSDGKITFNDTGGSDVTRRYKYTATYDNEIMRMRITYGVQGGSGSCRNSSGTPISCSNSAGCTGSNYSDAYPATQILYVKKLRVTTFQEFSLGASLPAGTSGNNLSLTYVSTVAPLLDENWDPDSFSISDFNTSQVNGFDNDTLNSFSWMLFELPDDSPLSTTDSFTREKVNINPTDGVKVIGYTESDDLLGGPNPLGVRYEWVAATAYYGCENSSLNDFGNGDDGEAACEAAGYIWGDTITSTRATLPIAECSTYYSAVQFYEQSFSIVNGTKYRCRFKTGHNGLSTIQRKMQIKLIQSQSDWHDLAAENDEIFTFKSSRMTYYEKIFTATETTSLGRLDFMLGGGDAALNASWDGVTVYFEDIELLPMEGSMTNSFDYTKPVLKYSNVFDSNSGGPDGIFTQYHSVFVNPFFIPDGKKWIFLFQVYRDQDLAVPESGTPYYNTVFLDGFSKPRFQQNELYGYSSQTQVWDEDANKPAGDKSQFRKIGALAKEVGDSGPYTLTNMLSSGEYEWLKVKCSKSYTPFYSHVSSLAAQEMGSPEGEGGPFGMWAPEFPIGEAEIGEVEDGDGSPDESNAGPFYSSEYGSKFLCMIYEVDESTADTNPGEDTSWTSSVLDNASGPGAEEIFPDSDIIITWDSTNEYTTNDFVIITLDHSSIDKITRVTSLSDGSFNFGTPDEIGLGVVSPVTWTITWAVSHTVITDTDTFGVYPAPLSAPSTPSYLDITETNSSNHTLYLQWQNVSGENGYRLEKRDCPDSVCGAWTYIADTPQNRDYYTQTMGASYDIANDYTEFRVRAYKSNTYWGGTVYYNSGWRSNAWPIPA